MDLSQGVGSGVGATLGALVFGPTGAIVGGFAGGFAESVVGNIAGSLGADGAKAVVRRTRERFVGNMEPQINHDLQRAFRDALREAIYDIGGATCFPHDRKPHAEADPADYPLTAQGHALWHAGSVLADQICECLRNMAQAVMDDSLLLLEPSAEQTAASGERYLLDATPRALNDTFYDQIVAPFLRSYRTLVEAAPEFKDHLRRHLLDRTLIHLGELLKSPQYSPAWRAFNRRIFEGLQAELRSIAAGQTAIAVDQQQIKQQLDALTNALNSEERIAAIAAQQADLLAAVGRLDKKLDEGFGAVLGRVTEQHRELLDRLRDGFRAVLYDTAVIKDTTTEIKITVEETHRLVEGIAANVQPASTSVPHTLPTRVTDFTGRSDEIDTLKKMLRTTDAGGAAATICAMKGLGGIGKSTLAVLVAHELAPAFPDGQIFLALRGARENKMSPEAALREVLRLFGKTPDPNLTLDQLGNDYRSMLHGKRVLIVADDAYDTAHIAPLKPPSGCALLITSRRWFRLEGMPDPLELGRLSEAEAMTFVTSVCPRIGDHAQELTTVLGRLPLALRFSATFLAKTSRPVERYLAELKNERKRLRLRGDDPELEGVEASFNLSYTALSQPAQTLLQQLGVFVPRFNRPMIDAVATLPQSTDDDPSLDDLLDELRSISLLDYDSQAERYSLHDLVRDFALDRLRANGDEAATRLRHAALFQTVAEQADQLFLQGGKNIAQGLALFDAARTQIDAAWTWLREQPPSQPSDQRLMQYADATVYVGSLRYNTRNERIPQLEAALAAARRQQDKHAEGRFLGNLGSAYAALGEVRRAIEFYEQHIAIAREIGDRQGEGYTLGNLGSAYYRLGEVRKALEFYEQALQIDREIGDRQGEGTVLGNLGSAYAALGDFQRAISSYEGHIAIATSIGDRSGEANSSWNLGRLLVQQGDVARGCALMQVYVDFERELGHSDAEKDAEVVERLRRQMEAGEG